MRLISRSILRELLAPFLLGLAAYTFLLLLRTIFQMTEFVVRRSASAGEVGKLLVLSLPWMLVLTLPMAFLLAVLVGVGRLSGDSELLAIRASGVGPWAIYRPVLGAAAVLSAGVFAFYNFVLPPANDALIRSMARVAATSVVNLLQPRTFREIRDGDTLFFDHIGQDGRSFEGVILSLSARDNEPLSNLILARRGSLTVEGDRLWLDLYESEVHEVDPTDPRRYRVNRNASQRILFTEDIFSRQREGVRYDKALRAQSLMELLETERRERASSPAQPRRLRQVRVEIHKKLALPLACFVFAFVGVPLAETSRRGGRGSGFAISILVLVVYYLLLTAGETWAEDGRLPPGLAIWMPNLLLLALGALLFRRRGLESPARRFRLPWRRPAIPGAAEPTLREGERRAWLEGLLRFPATLDRYVLARFFRMLALVLASVLVISLIFDYVERVDEILRNKPPGAVVAGYYRNFVIGIAVEVLPLVVLLATLIGLGGLSKTSEDTAFKASGVSLSRIGAPVVVAAAIGAVLVFWISESFLPYAKRLELRYRNVIYGRPADFSKREAGTNRQWHYGTDGRIWHRAASSPAGGILAQPTVLEFDSQMRLRHRTAAREASWSGRDWTLRQGWDRDFGPAGETSYRTFLQEGVAGDPPLSLAREGRTPAEMPLRELHAYSRRLKESGYPTEGLETAVFAKVARPLMLPLMALLGVPFAFKVGRRGALAGIGIGLALGMAFLVLSTLFTKFGDVGALPPLLAAWAPNVLFATAAAYMTLRMET
jgi:LPS export ABC transporter permease LptG/LPS export ABC transporter permease LptF